LPLSAIELSFLAVAACSPVTVATVEQQQWTDRLDISITVDSAGEFRLAAAATVFQVF